MLKLVRRSRRQRDPLGRLEVLGWPAHRSDVRILVLGAVKSWNEEVDGETLGPGFKLLCKSTVRTAPKTFTHSRQPIVGR